MAGQLTDQDQILDALKDNNSSKRRRAAVTIGKLQLVAMSSQLLDAYKSEMKDFRTWETQVAMIDALGVISYQPAYSLVKEICWCNEENSMITMAAAMAYVRISRLNISDARPVIELLEFGKYSVRMGCLNALGYDKMIPTESEIGEIIELVNKDPFIPKKGFSDNRYGLAAAAAGWPLRLVNIFLGDCLKSDDVPLRYVAENSMKGKYVKLR